MKTTFREVTDHEFWAIIDMEQKEAKAKMKRLMDTNGVVDPAWLFILDEVKVAYKPFPCSYNDYRNSIWCPISREAKPTRPVPKKFHAEIKPGVTYLRHATDDICPNLTLKHSTRCYARVNGRFYIGEHQVGKCPWKTARKETT